MRAQIRRVDRRSATSFCLVLAVHLLMFGAIASWRAPMMPVQGEGIDVSLVKGLGVRAPSPSPLAKPLTAPPQPPSQPDPTRITLEKPELLKVEAPTLDLKVSPAVLVPDNIRQLLIDVSLDPPLPVPLAGSPPVGSGGAAAPAAGGSKKCEIFDVIAGALQTSQTVRAAITIIPAKARSVANAVMIWDGAWADSAAMGGPSGLDPIRQAVLDGVAQAPPACRDDIVRGPRLVAVGDQHNTTVLAFGSGEWRWSDLVRTALQP